MDEKKKITQWGNRMMKRCCHSMEQCRARLPLKPHCPSPNPKVHSRLHFDR